MTNWLKVLKQFVIAVCLIATMWSVFLPSPAAIAATKSKLEIINDRLDELKPFIDANNWITVRTYIHGPLGQVRQDIGSAIRLLKDQTKAKELSTKFFNDLIAIDVSAGERDFDKTLDSYEQTRADFNQLVSTLQKF